MCANVIFSLDLLVYRPEYYYFKCFDNLYDDFLV